MKTDSPDIDKQQLEQTVNTEYGIQLSSITFVPKGEDAFAYVGETPSRKRYFIRVQPTAAANQLEQAYSISYTLHRQQGLRQVVAPYRTRCHSMAASFQNYTLAVFPYITGTTLYEQELLEADIRAAATLLAHVHDVPLRSPLLRHEQFDNPFSATILRALEATSTPGTAPGALQQEVCRLLLAQQADILATLERMERLQSRAGGLEVDWVLTHGDPNRDNFIKDQQGRLHVTDWGEVAYGPVERDLTHWTGETFEVFLQQYIDLRPQLRLHNELFEFYFYRWSLQEIADYATRILFRDLGALEDEHAWAALREYLPIQHNSIAFGLQEVQESIRRVIG